MSKTTPPDSGSEPQLIWVDRRKLAVTPGVAFPDGIFAEPVNGCLFGPCQREDAL